MRAKLTLTHLCTQKLGPELPPQKPHQPLRSHTPPTISQGVTMPHRAPDNPIIVYPLFLHCFYPGLYPHPKLHYPSPP